MAQHQQVWPIAILCEVLGVSRSGFYAYQQRIRRGALDHERLDLVARVKTLAATTRSSDGSRRIAQALQDDGFAVGRFKARRLMQEAGVTVKRPKKRGPFTTDIRHRDSVAPNVLARQFDVAQPNEAWAGDITYLWTAEG
jgi:putative transposase